jgi:membrane-associated phospholipid phosphatase
LVETVLHAGDEPHSESLGIQTQAASMLARERWHKPAHRVGRHPFAAWLVAWTESWALLAGLIITLGMLLTNVLVPNGVGSVDADATRWFVSQRTPALDTATLIGSTLGSTGVIIAIAVVAGIALAIGRHWRHLVFLASVVTLEASVSLLASIAVARERPTVPRLDVTPPTASYPSGHTAASIALYFALAIVISFLVRSRLIRTVVWILAVVLPVFVGLSRLYRGMHHLSDVVASVMLGAGALFFGLLVLRAALRAYDERRSDPEASPARDDELRWGGPT